MRPSRSKTLPAIDGGRHGWWRNLLVALDDTGVGTHYLVIERIGIVSAQQAARRHRQVHGDAAALDLHQLHDGGDIVGQMLIVGQVGDIAGDVVGGGDRNRPQQQQRRQHPVEDFAEQRIRVLEIDEGVGNPASCRKRREPPLALCARACVRRAGVRL
jgi:hypothetical protein